MEEYDSIMQGDMSVPNEERVRAEQCRARRECEESEEKGEGEG